MELIYFWYKNDNKTIKNSGFCFSQKYIFKNHFSKSNNFVLEIIENNDYIDNFYTSEFSNISNLAAIIGSNGVGKTNLLHLLIDLLTDNLPFKDSFIAIFQNECKIEICYNVKSFKLEIIDNGFKDYKIIPFKEYSIFGDKRREFKLKHTKVIYYNPAFDLRDYPFQISPSNRKHIDISTNTLIETDSANYKNLDKLLFHKFSNIRRSLILSYSTITELENINFPQITQIVFYMNYFTPEKDASTLSDENLLIFDFIQTKIKKENSQDLSVQFSECLVHNFFHFLDEANDFDLEIDINELETNSLYSTLSIFFKKQKFVKDIDLLYDNVLKGIELTKGKFIDSDRQNNSFTFETDNLIALEILTTYESFIKSASRIITTTDFIHFNWRNISTGEKCIIDLFSRLNYAHKIIKESTENISFVYLFIDEGDIGLHPQWQKSYINKLLKFIDLLFIGYSVQIIITSHSPLIISDIPKSNLIFLKRIGEFCELVDIDKEETFASNIHSLFTDSFFIENGLIGDFAKNKINQVIKYIKNDSRDVDNINEIRKIIKIIGEPVLKNKISQMFEYTFNLPIDIDYEIISLEERLSQLKIINKK